MSDTSLMYWNAAMGKTQSRCLRLAWNITAAKTVSLHVLGAPVMVSFDTAWTQANIDDFLGTSSEFNYLAFDSTAVGADTFSGVVNMKGQAAAVSMFRATCYSGTAGATKVELAAGVSTALTASTIATEIQLGSSGNIAFKCNFGNTPDFDGLTAGIIEVEIFWVSK